MKHKLVIGNWKMYGSREANQRLLAEALPELAILADITVVICPPYPYLEQVNNLLQGSQVKLGAQDVNAQTNGAFTGEVSVSMLRDVGCAFVLLGHSERRILMGETDAQMAEKYAAALAGGLTPVLCVGETLGQRQSGITEQVIISQLQAVVDTVGVLGLAAGIIAYEPVWAIGTGESATPEQAQAVHAHIRAWLAEQLPTEASSPALLYGGSVKADNAQALFSQTDIDGGLIGGASLDASAFAAICRAAQGSALDH